MRKAALAYGENEMEELLKFRAWAQKIGHYHITEGIDRYLKMLESLENKS